MTLWFTSAWRGRRAGQKARAMHTLLNRTPLAGERLLDEAKESARKDFAGILWQFVYEDPRFIFGFLQGYLGVEVRITPYRVEIRDITPQEYLEFARSGQGEAYQIQSGSDSDPSTEIDTMSR